MSRRLAIIRACVVCGDSFRPCHQKQLTCSVSCGSIRRIRKHPATGNMLAANARRREQFLAQRKAYLAGLTPVEAYALGVKDCYSRFRQRRIREARETA